jgi:zinc protease
MKKVLLFLLAACSFAAAAQTLPAGVTRSHEVEGITEYRLANGLQVLLVPDDAKPTTTVNLIYRVGSRHENYGETGMAHLLEHLIFKGTPTTPNVWGEFVKRGLRPNGTTSFDRTNYFASFSSANPDTLRWYLSWQADAMVNSRIARTDLDSEMTVVRNEMESGENNPGRVLLQQTMAAMYQWHNYGKAIIGARSDVENVDITRLQAFYRRHYQPDNATLIVTGKFDVPRTLGWIAEFFAPIPKPQRALDVTYTLDAVQDGERQVTLRRSGGTPVLYAAYHLPAGAHPDFAAAELLALILGDAPSGRLHRALVDKQLAASVFGFAWDLAEPGPLFVGAQLAPGQDVTKARSAMTAATESFARTPVTDAEVERARAQWLKAWYLGFTDPERVGVELSEAVAKGDWRLYFLARDRIRALKRADVQRVATERLLTSNRTAGTYVPTENPQRAPAPVQVDVAAVLKDFRGDAAAARVEAFDPTPANLDARTQTFTLAGGMKVALLPKGARGQLAQARLRLHYGDEASLRGQATVADFVAALLDKGTARLTRQQISDRLDQLRAVVSFDAGGQTLAVSITAPRDSLAAVIDLVGQLLREPAFPADALEEVRRQALAGLAQARQEPAAVIAKLLDRHANPYPKGDLRHEPTFDEEVQAVREVKIDQLRNFHRRFYGAAHAEFGAAGDIDAAAVRQALEAAFGNWRAAQPYRRITNPLVDKPALRVLVQTPDKQNAEMRVELPLPLTDTHADYPALTMANHLFGFFGVSRLWNRIREQEGLSYDVRSFVQWNPWEPNSPWVATAIFAPQNQPKVEAALKAETERALKEGFTQQELDEGRRGLLEYRRQSRAQDGNVASTLASNLELNRTFMVSQQVDDALAKLTLEQVNTAWRTYQQPARWVAAYGGDFEKAGVAGATKQP